MENKKKQSKHPDGLEIYKGKNNEFYWRYYKKGRIIAGSTEGYKSLNGIHNNLLSIYDMSIFTIFNAQTVYKQKLRDARKSVSNRGKKR